MRVSLEHLRETAGLRAAWLDLQSRAEAGFFLSWAWIGTWVHETDLVGSGRAWVMRIEESGRLVGLGIFVECRERRRKILNIRQLRLHETGDPEQDVVTIEYNGLLIERGKETAVWRAALDHLQTLKRPNWDEVIVGGATPDIEERLASGGLTTLRRAETTSARVDLSGLRTAGVHDLEGYAGSLGKSTRAQLRRSLRLYEERGPLRLEAAGTQDQARAFMAELKTQHQARWEERGQRGAFGWPFYVRFHERLIAAELGRGVEILRISAGDQPFGWLYNFLTEDAALYYLGGFVFEEDNRLKPGLVAHAMAALWHLEAGRSVYDFMGGDNRYKRNLGKAGPDILALAMQRPRLALKAERGLQALKRRVVRRG